MLMSAACVCFVKVVQLETSAKFSFASWPSSWVTLLGKKIIH